MATVDHFMDSGEPHERAEAALLMAHDTLSDPHASDDDRAASHRLIVLGLEELTSRLTPTGEAISVDEDDPRPPTGGEGSEWVEWVAVENGATYYEGPLPSVRDAQVATDASTGTLSAMQAIETGWRRWLDKIVSRTPSRPAERPLRIHVNGVDVVGRLSLPPEVGLTYKGTRVDTPPQKIKYGYGTPRRDSDEVADSKDSASPPLKRR